MALKPDSSANWYATTGIFKLDNYKSFPRTSKCWGFSQAIFFNATQSLFSASGNITNTGEPLEPTGKLNVHVIRNGSVSP